MVPAKCKYANNKSSAYLRGTWLKTEAYQTVIGVPPVRKYANYRTLIIIAVTSIIFQFMMTGSEDFNVYLWKVPKLDKDHVGIAKVEQSSLALKGHRSIVNQACFNRDTAMICSSGVEKSIKVSLIMYNILILYYGNNIYSINVLMQQHFTPFCMIAL